MGTHAQLFVRCRVLSPIYVLPLLLLMFLVISLLISLGSTSLSLCSHFLPPAVSGLLLFQMWEEMEEPNSSQWCTALPRNLPHTRGSVDDIFTYLTIFLPISTHPPSVHIFSSVSQD